MSLNVNCIICKAELQEQGALFFSSPNTKGTVVKIHLCIGCEGYFNGMIIKAQLKEDKRKETT